MRKRVGTKIYDTDTAVLVDTLEDGIMVYRKKNSPQFFLYNPNGEGKREMFFELPPDQAAKYLEHQTDASRKVRGSQYRVNLSPYDRNRIMAHATALGMSMNQFIIMLVDEYERSGNVG